MSTIYETVTASIIASLESGVAPWVKPWTASHTADKNAISGKAYRGVNRFLLGMAFQSSNEWATFKQWQEMGASVKKGEKATHIVYFSPVTKPKKGEDGEESGPAYSMLKTYCVFNASQVDGYAPPVIETDSKPFDINALCEDRIVKTGAMVSHGGDMAFYSPSADRVQLPNKAAFITPEDYYATAFHELTHWTGHNSRLDRKGGRFGDAAYAYEELVAELGAAFLCQDHAIAGKLQHAAYIQSWLNALKTDSRLIFKAAAAAQKAADFILTADATAVSVAA